MKILDWQLSGKYFKICIEICHAIIHALSDNTFYTRERRGGSYNHYTRRGQLRGADRKRLEICFKINSL